jgi:SAM-dependent methyltransferase
MTDPETIDPIWEKKYSEGHAERYPWDCIVSFIFSNAPRDRVKNEIRILEVGFGTGSNLWFAAREGFSVAGVEGSKSAVEFANKRFLEDGLQGDLRVGDFTNLSFEDEYFDLVIDRGALCCVGETAQKKAIQEVHRVLKKGGKFHYNGYADSHSSYRAGIPGPDRVIQNITGGNLVGVGQIHFISRKDIDLFFAKGWELLNVQRLELTDMLTARGNIHAEWFVVAEKTDG